MLVSEILGAARSLGKDPYPGTYSDQALIQQLDLVCIEAIERVLFPYARISTATVANQQEYQLPETPLDDGMGCVYLNGQLLTKTDVATLQGQQISIYDQQGMGTQSAGSGGPTANAGNFVPSWTVQPPGAFPAPNYQALRNFTAPYYPNSGGFAPQYYLRGGFIGIVPAPNASAAMVNGVPVPNLVVDVCMSFAYAGPFVWDGEIAQSQTLQATGSRIWYPSIFKNYLTWGLAERIAAMDDTGSTKEARGYCGGKAQEALDRLMHWARSFRSDDRIKRQTNRSRYSGYRWCRNAQYGGYP